MIKEYDLQEEIDQVAMDISVFESNPTTWLRWVVYFLSRLEKQALDVNPTHQVLYDNMLSMLQDTVRNRRRTGGW
jgi:hypothetical protein